MSNENVVYHLFKLDGTILVVPNIGEELKLSINGRKKFQFGWVSNAHPVYFNSEQLVCVPRVSNAS